MQKNFETLTRKQLYDLVWAIPLLTLSKKYKLSDNGIRKICKKMSITLPIAGHWVKIQFKKSTAKKDLPKDYFGTPSVELPLRNAEDDGSLVTNDPVKLLANKLREDSNLSLAVPDRLHTKDPLILKAKSRLTGDSFKKSNGLISCYSDELDISVTSANVSRSLRFMDTLFRILRQRGHSVHVRIGSTYVTVNQQEFKIMFRERCKREMVKGTYYDSSVFHPTGILVFKIDGYYGKEWQDGKHPLDHYLPNIVAKLEIESDLRNKQAEENRKQWEKIQNDQRIKEAWLARKEKEIENFKVVLEESERWHKASNLRNYIQEVELKAGNVLTTELVEWLAWARKKADWYDPFVEASDELLDGFDKRNLENKKKIS